TETGIETWDRLGFGGPPETAYLRLTAAISLPLAIATGGRIGHTREAGPQFVQSQEHGPTGPAKHGFCAPSTAVEVVQNHLSLKRPSLGPGQFLGRVFDGGNVRFLQFVHHPLPETSASVPKPKLGKGNSKRESLGS